MARKTKLIKIQEPEEAASLKYRDMVFTKDSYIVIDDMICSIDLMPDLETVDTVESQVAYLQGDYFYVFRGIGNIDNTEGKKPGIYQNRHAYPKFFIVEPSTDEEKAEYTIAGHAYSIHPTSIIDAANTTEELLVAIPESTKFFQPQITENDDILKLVAKKALLEKNVDLDRYKDRFANKNELFNLKQIFRGDNKMSMRIFNRCMDALNLKYEIILTEKGPNHVVGDPLKNPVRVFSEETYEL